jgi:Protein of unknown function (DUF2628)
MASWIVMEPVGNGRAGSSANAAFIRDGFSWPGFLLPPLWLLWHRLWIEAALAIAAAVLAAGLQWLTGLATTAPLLWLLVAVFVGLEGNALRVAALSRRGWHSWGVVEAGNLDDADTHYAAETATAEAGAPDRSPTSLSPPSANSGARPVQGEPIGLLLNRGR